METPVLRFLQIRPQECGSRQLLVLERSTVITKRLLVRGITEAIADKIK